MAMRSRTGVGALLLAAGLVVALLAGYGGIVRGYEALLALGDIAAGSEESRLKERTPAPTREDLRYRVDGRDYRADLYRPDEPRRGTLILVHGLTDAGRRDPLLMGFALTMSRLGFTVMVPDLEGLKAFSLDTRDVEAIADAIRHATQKQPEAASTTALASTSLAVGPTLLAAMQEDTADRVSFLVALGGYYDLTDMLRYVTTGEDPGAAGQDTPAPREEMRWLVLLSQRQWLDDERDRALLGAIARRRLHDPAASVEAEVNRLGPQGRAAYDLLANEDPDRVAPLMTRLPAPLRAELKALDLSARDLGKLQAELVLVHGPDDPVIPVSHSRRLKNALPEGQARLFEARGLDHVEVSPNWRDGWTLWRAVHHVLRLGDGETTPP